MNCGHSSVLPVADLPSPPRKRRLHCPSPTSYAQLWQANSRSNLFGDVIFDSMWSDMAFHRKIQDANARLDAGSAVVRQGADAVGAATADAERAALRAQAEINVARKKLDGVRREIFERAANPAPQYSAAPTGGQTTTAFAPPPGAPPVAQQAAAGTGGFAPPAGPPPGQADIPPVPPPEYRP